VQFRGEAQKILENVLAGVLKGAVGPAERLVRQRTHRQPATRLFATLDAARVKSSHGRGRDIKQWTWGQRTPGSNSDHPLDSVPGAAALSTREPIDSGGPEGSRRQTAIWDIRSDQLLGASYREIFDLEDWDRSVGINVPGQSGSPAVSITTTCRCGSRGVLPA